MNRQKFIEIEIKNEPNNPFNYYLLALEFRKNEDFNSFEMTLEDMLVRFTAYLPTYYVYAEYLFQVENFAKGSQIAKLGIKLAEEIENGKLKKELEQLIELSGE
jgi:hypothetical protein